MRIKVALALAALLAGVTACAPAEQSAEPPITSTITVMSEAPVAPTTSTITETTEVSAAEDSLARIVAETESVYGGTAVIATSDGANTSVAGRDDAYPAWSTSKVPIAIAALRKDPSLQPTMAQAIEVSDNTAAQALWATVTPEEVNSVLAAGGSGTTINTAVIRPEFSTFGQTHWSTADQAQFGANLPGIAGSEAVIASMGRIVPDQSYGLGQLPGARFKGGWGPTPEGNYIIRQFGFLPGSSLGLALTVAPADGAYATGQAMASHLAGLLTAELGANQG